jgi:hypothetical protein
MKIVPIDKYLYGVSRQAVVVKSIGPTSSLKTVSLL